MKIIVAGATGMVGREMIARLAAHKASAIGRRPVHGVAENLIGAVEDWPALVASAHFDVAVSALGTTIRHAGSRAAFHAIDHDAVMVFAEAAKRAGARQFMMVSPVGASASSSNFYLKTKGEVEASVAALGFDRVDIVRPGLLRGDRDGPSRPAERIAMLVSPLTDLLTPSVFDHYRSITAADVAKAIAALIGHAGPGIHIHKNRDMLREAARIG